MSRIACLFIVGAGLCRIAFAESAEPDNGPALVRVLLREYRIEAYLNRERQVHFAAVTHEADVRKAIDRLSQITSLERVAVLGGVVDRKLLEKLGKLPRLWLLV